MSIHSNVELPRSSLESEAGDKMRKIVKPVNLPVIDLLQLNHTSTKRALTVEDIGQACCKLGCFQVVNHGIDKSVTAGALQAAASFFELPAREKERIESQDMKKPIRYASASNSGNSNSKAFLKHYANPLSQWIPLWPPEPYDYREKMGKYSTEVKRVALQLMDAILESLELDKGYLRDKLEEGMQVVAVNDYNPSDQKEIRIGLEAHTDYGYITILLQNCDGLQIFDKDSKTWNDVPIASELLNVHIGDYLEVLSNGRYKSVVHRAVLNSEKRMSIASIHCLAMDEKVTTPEKLVDEQYPKNYKESSFSEFLDYVSNVDKASRKSYLESLKIITS